jgi:hypothetical protein
MLQSCLLIARMMLGFDHHQLPYDRPQHPFVLASNLHAGWVHHGGAYYGSCDLRTRSMKEILMVSLQVYGCGL